MSHWRCEVMRCCWVSFFRVSFPMWDASRINLKWMDENVLHCYLMDSPCSLTSVARASCNPLLWLNWKTIKTQCVCISTHYTFSPSFFVFLSAKKCTNMRLFFVWVSICTLIILCRCIPLLTLDSTSHFSFSLHFHRNCVCLKYNLVLISLYYVRYIYMYGWEQILLSHHNIFLWETITLCKIHYHTKNIKCFLRF